MDTKEVKLFMESTRRNTWLRCGHYALYVRKGMHLIEGRVQSCFDIASVNCDEDQMGKGHFKTLLKALTRLAKIHELEALLIECVLNDRLAEYLPKHGFTLIPNTYPPSFYLKLNP